MEIAAMPAQLNIFLLLFGGLQGLLVSLFLIRKKLHRSGYAFLLLYFGVMLLQITLKVMNKAWLMQNWGFLYWTSYFFPFLYGPLVFLFVRQLLLDKKFRVTDLLHFLPFLLFLSGAWLWDSIGDLKSFYLPDSKLILQLCSVLIYHGLAFRDWHQYNNAGTDLSIARKLQINWMRQFIIASCLVCTIIAVAIYLLYINYPRGAGYRYAFVALTVFIYWVSYTALFHPAVFSSGKGQPEGIVTPLLPKLLVQRPAKKYSNSGLSETDMAVIRQRLEKLMVEQRPYLDAELTINDLAALIKCNRHHLSQVLNESLKKSFYDYINHYRVDEARQLLLDHAKDEYKIASIAYDAGFNSLSTFNDVFKKITGTTPSQFRKRTEQEQQQRMG